MASAAVIIIGNEVLSGKVEEQNARFLITELRALGIALERVVVIRDQIEIIAEEVRLATQRYDHVFTSGGVGATHDDVTMEGVAAGLGVGLADDAELAALIRDSWQGEAPPRALRMARLPEGAELLRPPGTLRFPVVRAGKVYILPGVPEFLRAKFHAIAPMLSAGAPFVVKEVFVTSRESAIADVLEAVERAHADVEIGSYPRFDTEAYRVRITIESRSPDAACAAEADLRGRLDPAVIVEVPA